jgi:hypothetical protein
VCINITQVGANSSASYKYSTGKLACFLLYLANSGAYFAYVNPTATAVSTCPTDKTGLTEISANPRAPANCANGGNGNVPAQDICMGFFNPQFVTGESWACFSGYYERVALPVWVSSFGFAANLVQGRMFTCSKNITYALLHIPLPAPPASADQGESWWAKYGKIVLGVTISMFLLLLILAYAISRLIRYREKYLVEKRDAEALREEAKELDEKHGGLGVYDEEVEMIANPLVVQMQELQKQLEQTNASLQTQEELDATQMAAMDKERQRILEEIKRVKDAIAAQKKQTPTAAYDAPATNPTTTSGPTSAQPASSERQEFVQSAPPRRKKNEF